MKKIRKFLPLSIYDIPGIERWLEEQAQAGLFPVYLNSWATFEPSGIPGTRFRLEPWGKEGSPTEEQLELTHQAGWEYAFTIGQVYFLFYTTDPKAPELYTDLESRGLSLERLEKRVQSNRRFCAILWSVLSMLLVWALFFQQSAYDVQPDRFAHLPLLLLALFHPVILLFLVTALLSWKHNRRDRGILKRTCQALQAGLLPPPSVGPRPALAREQKLSLLLIPLFLAAWLFLFMGDHGQLSVPVEDFTRPYVSLQELEQVDLVRSQEIFGPSAFREDENRAENHISLLSPVWYSVSQSGCEAAVGDYEGYSPDPQGGKYRYSPSLDATYFQLLLPALARPVAQSQMNRDRAINLYWTYEELSYPGLDFVILATEPKGIHQGLALGKDGRVAVFHYSGVKQLADHLDILATELTKNGNG